MLKWLKYSGNTQFFRDLELLQLFDQRGNIIFSKSGDNPNFFSNTDYFVVYFCKTFFVIFRSQTLKTSVFFLSKISHINRLKNIPILLNRILPHIIFSLRRSHYTNSTTQSSIVHAATQSPLIRFGIIHFDSFQICGAIETTHGVQLTINDRQSDLLRRNFWTFLELAHIHHKKGRCPKCPLSKSFAGKPYAIFFYRDAFVLKVGILLHFKGI